MRSGRAGHRGGMSRGGGLMGKRATVTQVVHTSKNKDGFVEDAFWGPTAPRAIAHLPAAIEEHGRENLRAALGLAVRHLEGRAGEDEDAGQVGEALMSGALSVLVAAVRSAAQESQVLRDLQNLHIAPECAQDIAQVLAKKGTSIQAGAAVRGPRFPHIDELRWRVDVTISTTVLSRVMRPALLLQFTLSDGSIKTIEVSAEQLQDMRYDVAVCLKAMQELETSSRLFNRLPASQTPAVKADGDVAAGRPAQTIDQAVRARAAAVSASPLEGAPGPAVPDF